MKPLIRWTGLVLATVMVAILLPQTAPTQAQGTSRTCMASFEFALTEGPSAPLTILGMLTLNISDSGAFTGTLEGYEGKLVTKGKASLPNRLSVMGQANGHAISMMISLPGGKKIYGTGASEGSLSTCNGKLKGDMGGPAVGPAVGDQGDWRRLCPKGYQGAPSEC